MPLNEHESELWKHAIANFDEIPEIDPELIKIPTDTTFETIAELLEAIERYRWASKVSDEEMLRIHGFVDDMFASGDPRAVLAELPYEIDSSGAQRIVLSFPNFGSDRPPNH